MYRFVFSKVNLGRIGRLSESTSPCSLQAISAFGEVWFETLSSYLYITNVLNVFIRLHVLYIMYICIKIKAFATVCMCFHIQNNCIYYTDTLVLIRTHNIRRSRYTELRFLAAIHVAVISRVTLLCMPIPIDETRIA